MHEKTYLFIYLKCYPTVKRNMIWNATETCSIYLSTDFESLLCLFKYFLMLGSLFKTYIWRFFLPKTRMPFGYFFFRCGNTNWNIITLLKVLSFSYQWVLWSNVSVILCLNNYWKIYATFKDIYIYILIKNRVALLYSNASLCTIMGCNVP